MQRCPIGWFALDDAHPHLRAHRDQGGVTCGVRDGHVRLFVDGVDHDLGAVADMPLTFAASARYNIANIAAAALAASRLGIAATTIAAVLADFGREHGDNPGRLQHWVFGDLQVFIDYAHNPEGLRGLLDVATRTRGHVRLGVLLGQAGNREDKDIRELAATAARFHPDLVVLKDIDGFMRGREQGEVAGLLRDELLRCGLPSEQIVECLDEASAVRDVLAWAQAGDILVLPIHGTEARREVNALLAQLQQRNWRVGQAL